ncbi:MAG TPA: hypothetical protein V6D07_16090, partial [Trichocoleus sp.]
KSETQQMSYSTSHSHNECQTKLRSQPPDLIADLHKGTTSASRTYPKLGVRVNCNQYGQDRKHTQRTHNTQ